MTHYDIIGDIHGHADKLRALLEKLGYARDADGPYSHPTRQVIFLGDFIDRGPKQMEVVEIVRAMVDHGSARAVMGNHEFNAIGYATENPNEAGSYLRPHSEKNQKQHREYIDQVLASKSPQVDWIAWFKTLPLFLEIDGIRIVHACWHQESIDRIRKWTSAPDVSIDAFMLAANTKGSPEHFATEAILKGPEKNLPDGQTFHDKDNIERDAVRIAWWECGQLTFRDHAVIEDHVRNRLPNTPMIGVRDFQYDPKEPPVFFGHYWRQGTPCILTANTACLDFSVAGKHGGYLACYRWSGENALVDENFVWV